MTEYSNRFLIKSLLLLSFAFPGKYTGVMGQPVSQIRHYLYVATPGVRNYLEYGGHGLLIFDIDHDCKFVKRIPTGGLDKNAQPSNVKGICVSLPLYRIYISTLTSMFCIDLLTEKTIWEKNYEGGCDRMAISPEGKIIYLPSLEGDDWKVVDALSGNVLYRVVTRSGSHNTIYGPDGRQVYLEGLKSEYLSVVQTVNHTVRKKIGPFANHVRPFTIDGKQTRCYVNVDGLLGFETGDLKTGRKINHIVVQGYVTGPVKRHGCPSHGIALTPNEKEIWLADGFNESVHIFDIHLDSVKQKESIKLSDQPGWITFSLNGKYAFPSTGDVIDARVKRIVARLQDEFGTYVQSEKMVEIDFRGSQPVKSGNQFGIGRKE